MSTRERVNRAMLPAVTMAAFLLTSHAGTFAMLLTAFAAGVLGVVYYVFDGGYADRAMTDNYPGLVKGKSGP